MNPLFFFPPANCGASAQRRSKHANHGPPPPSLLPSVTVSSACAWVGFERLPSHHILPSNCPESSSLTQSHALDAQYPTHPVTNSYSPLSIPLGALRSEARHEPRPHAMINAIRRPVALGSCLLPRRRELFIDHLQSGPGGDDAAELPPSAPIHPAWRATTIDK